jgi:S1-C subfamily serine protease
MNRSCIRGLLGTILLLGSLAPPLRANPEVYERTLHSTAWVVSAQPDRVSSGTGVLLDVSQKLVLTSYHTVEDQPKALIFFPLSEVDQLVTEPAYYLKKRDRVAITGRVIATDPKRDLALIRLDTVPKDAKALPLAGRSPRPGETVHAIGNSGVRDGVLWRYSKGEVRQVYRRKLRVDEDDRTFEVEARMVETQIPANPGDSGGPVVNDRGELVGITQGGNLSSQLVTFAIDVSEVQTVVARLKDSAASANPSLVDGVWNHSGTLADEPLKDIKLKLRSNGTFVLASVNAEGDIVESIEGRYRFADGWLVLTRDGEVLLEGKVRWVSDDEFVLRAPGAAIRWTRLKK